MRSLRSASIIDACGAGRSQQKSYCPAYACCSAWMIACCCAAPTEVATDGSVAGMVLVRGEWQRISPIISDDEEIPGAQRNDAAEVPGGMVRDWSFYQFAMIRSRCMILK